MCTKMYTKFIDLIINSALIWIFMQGILNTLITIIYDSYIPWIVWNILIILIILRLVRIAAPPSNIIKEVLGTNPYASVSHDDVPEDENNEEQYYMRMVAHRGAGFDYPENSLLALRSVKEKGCTAVEIDLRLTKDNIPIIFHDPTIERLTGQPGIISKMTWEELRDVDISLNHPLRNKFGNGEKIALLHDALQECLKNEQRVIIDIKETRLDVVQVIIDTYKKYPKLFQRAVISSFNPIIIYMIRKKEPRIVSALAWRPYFFSRSWYTNIPLKCGPVRYRNIFKHLMACTMEIIYEWLLSRFIYDITGISVVLLHKDTINTFIIDQWYERGVRVMVWTINRPIEKIHFSKLLKITYLTDTLHTEADMQYSSS